MKEDLNLIKHNFSSVLLTKDYVIFRVLHADLLIDLNKSNSYIVSSY